MHTVVTEELKEDGMPDSDSDIDSDEVTDTVRWTVLLCTQSQHY